MALIESGIKLEMQNADGFLRDGRAVDELLNKMAMSADKAVNSLNKLPNALQKIKIPKSITNVDVSGINQMVDSINRLSSEVKTNGLDILAQQIKQVITPVTSLSNAINRLTKQQDTVRTLGTTLNQVIGTFRNLDTSGIQDAVRALSELAMAARDINKAMALVANRSSALGENAEKSGRRFAEFAAGIRVSNTEFDKFVIRIRTVLRRIQRVIDVFRAGAKIITTFRKTIIETGRAITIFSNAFRALFGNFSIILKPLQLFEKVVKALINPLGTLRKLILGISKGFAPVGRNVSNSARGLEEYDRQIRRVIQSNGRLNSSFQALSGASNLISIFRDISNAIGNLIGRGFDAAADFEQLTLSIQNLTARELFSTGDFDSLGAAFNEAKMPAQELLTTIRAIAIQSPFNANDIAQTFKLAQVYGFARDNALALTQSITDFTAATGQSGEVGEGIIRALGQIKANTTLAKEELNQLAERGLNATTILAKEFGITAKEVLDLTSKRLIPADAAINAIAKTLQNDFSGAAEKATKTLSGLRSTLQDLADNVLRELTTGAFSAVAEVVSEFTTVENIFSTLDQVREIGERFGKQIAQALQTLLVVGRNLIEFWQALPEPVKNAISILGQIATTAGIVTVAVAAVSAAVAALGFVFSAFVGTTGILIASVTAIISVFTTLENSSETTKSTLDKLRESVLFIITDFSTFTDTLQRLFNIANQEGINLAQFSEFPEFLENIVSAGLDVVITFNQIIDTITEAQTPFEALFNLVGLLPDKFAMFGQALLNAQSITEAYQVILNQLPVTLQNILNSVVTFASQFTGTFTRVRDFIANGVTSIIDFLSTIFSSFVDWGANIIVELAKGIRSAVGLVIDAINFIGSVITDLLAPGSPPKILPDLPQWGKNVADQFLRGLSLADFSLIGSFGDTVGEIFSQFGLDEASIQGIVQSFSEGLNQINLEGTLDVSVFDNIMMMAGAAGAEVTALAAEYFELAEAQRRLNSLTSEYDEELRAVNSTLSDIENREQFADEQKRLDEINRRLQNRNLSDAERSALLREQEKINAQRQAREFEAQKRIAQQEVQDSKDNIKRIEERLKLSGEFASEEDKNAANSAARASKLRKKAAKEINSLNKLAESLFGDLESGLDLEFSGAGLDKAKEQVGQAVEGIRNRFTDFFANVEERFKKISEFFSIDGIRAKISELQIKFGELQLSVEKAFFVGRSTQLTEAIENLDFSTLRTSIESISMLIGSTIGEIQRAFNFGELLNFETALEISDFSTLESSLESISMLAGSVKSSIQELFTFEVDDDNAVAGFIDSLRGIDFQSIGQNLQDFLLPVLTDVGTGLADLFRNLITPETIASFGTLLGIVRDITIALLGAVVVIGKLVAAIGGPLGDSIALVFTTAVNLLAGLRDIIVNVANIFVGIFTLNLDKIKEGFVGLLVTVGRVLLTLQQLWSGLNTFIGDAFTNLFNIIAEGLGVNLDEFGGKISETLGDLVSSMAGIFVILRNFSSQVGGVFARIVSQSPFLQRLIGIFNQLGAKAAVVASKFKPVANVFARVLGFIVRMIPFTGTLSKAINLFLGPAGALLTIMGILATLWFNNVAGIGDFVTRVGELAGEMELSFQGITTFVTGVFSELGTLIGNIVSELSMISFDDIFNFFTDEGAFDRIVVLGTTLISLLPIITKVGAAIPLLTNPIGLLIGAVGLLALVWSQNWFGIQDVTKQALDSITEFLSGFFFWSSNFGYSCQLNRRLYRNFWWCNRYNCWNIYF